MHAEAARLLAAAEQLARAGERGRALQALSRALDLAPEDAAAPYAALIAGVSPSGWHPKLDSDLRTCLASPAVDPQMLARVTARVLLLHYPEPAVAEDPLWIAFLTRCINVDPAMEARLVWLAGQKLPEALRAALAAQAFASEYAWGGEGLGVPPEAAAEIAEERRLVEALPSLSPVRKGERGVSDAVRAQYEANPYPRWRAPPAPEQRSVGELLAALGAPQLGPLEVLVAGCGTGFEPIDLARTDPSLRVTALDLSAASLAHGQRVARALGVAVRFIQGDILDVAALGRDFAMVSSTGVLHHMADPAAGLTALAGVTRPGGVLRIALYSERARAWVREAHRAIAEHGFAATPEGIRAFRRHVLALPAGDPLARLAESDDFYTLSGCRDLAFHAHEHWYRLPEIGAILAVAGLELLRIETPPGAPFPADPLDLAGWDAIEARHPHLFAGMIHLWIRRP